MKHVWIVALAEHSLDEVAANTGQMPYLRDTLRPKGLTVPEAGRRPRPARWRTSWC